MWKQQPSFVCRMSTQWRNFGLKSVDQAWGVGLLIKWGSVPTPKSESPFSVPPEITPMCLLRPLSVCMCLDVAWTATDTRATRPTTTTSTTTTITTDRTTSTIITAGGILLRHQQLTRSLYVGHTCLLSVAFVFTELRCLRFGPTSVILSVHLFCLVIGYFGVVSKHLSTCTRSNFHRL